MRQNAENVLAVLRTKEFSNLLQDPEEKEALFRDLLTALAAAGFSVVKPAALETEAPSQVKSCLMVAHYQLAGQSSPSIDLARDKIEVSLHIIQALEDYLRELYRLGTQVPLTWREFVQAEYQKKFVGNRELSDNLQANGSNNEIGISTQTQPVPAEGY